ncbi:phosphatase PAP2 family protein, partial [Streptomyces europaeiscabiei]
LLHPFLTVLAIVATGNHWILDAVGGAAVVGAGFGLTYLLTGPRTTEARMGRGEQREHPPTAGRLATAARRNGGGADADGGGSGGA